MTVSRDLGTLILFLPYVALLGEKGQLRGKIDLRDWKPVLVWVVVIVLAVVVDGVLFKPSLISLIEGLVVTPLGAFFCWLGMTVGLFRKDDEPEVSPGSGETNKSK
ncbi:hypothetical protein [Roseibacillus persicicus]|uniref:hypothetical protein n=1 Tax=Roseibacillus persicicus TaxID=454148 RepID=UPI00280CAD42|nr:hypothetical protein [Roseibacillus persicicus]MDQ8192492.1 hypothetical protein [Roseibacillus persicicus]